ncbi:MAG: exonuclease subunit SbcD [Methyloprofundus sp.]|nr:exonuclease subunit SbcD [Methyloprofundus sp.]
MLRIIHTADWHLGHHLHGVSRNYEQQQFLDWLLLQLEQQHADVLIVAGDIFDTANPSAAAQSQLYDFLVKARAANPVIDIILIGGNHDSAARLDAPSALLKALGISVVGGLSKNATGEIDWQRLLIPLSNQRQEIKAWCAAMPFLRHADLPDQQDATDPLVAGVKTLYTELIQQVKQQAGADTPLLLTGHCYMVGGHLSELSERKILGGNQHALPVDIFPDDISYTALGHLHRAQSVGKDESIRYSGSPIPLSFDEQLYQHQVLQVDLQADKSVKTTPLIVPRSVKMIRIPNGQDYCSLAEALEKIQELQLNTALVDYQQPVLEIRIALDKPEPGLRQQIEHCLEGLPLRLLKISIAYTGTGKGLADVVKEERLEELLPEHVFQRCYQSKYNTQVPDDITVLFHELQENLQEVE